MRFEEITLKHLDEVVDFYIESFNSPPWNDKWTRTTAKNRLTQMINCEGSYGLVCFYENKPVGMILGNHEYYYDCLHFNIKELCIDNSKKGMGIGKKLLNEFTLRLKDKKIKKIYLYTLKSNMTERFYIKNGYETIEEIIMMEKTI